MIDESGILGGAEPGCPVCGKSLGYYAELGDNVECEHCGSKMFLNRDTPIHYYLYEVKR